ncbi:hypothetical protein T4A_10082 [Trichinella pseudospiralis]|uniref:Uncharacterized protein n=1 Tax=Trichinella pseudospiralis TaxID=6337 RepID=A0A0V1DRM6_TRIPS|nr:hypothetical protein T4A_10082 [Trichinella pseudospiralis]
MAPQEISQSPFPFCMQDADPLGSFPCDVSH